MSKIALAFVLISAWALPAGAQCRLHVLVLYKNGKSLEGAISDEQWQWLQKGKTRERFSDICLQYAVSGVGLQSPDYAVIWWAEIAPTSEVKATAKQETASLAISAQAQSIQPRSISYGVRVPMVNMRYDEQMRAVVVGIKQGSKGAELGSVLYEAPPAHTEHAENLRHGDVGAPLPGSEKILEDCLKWLQENSKK